MGQAKRRSAARPVRIRVVCRLSRRITLLESLPLLWLASLPRLLRREGVLYGVYEGVGGESVKTINQEIAERIGRDFAKEHSRPMDDPLVKDLIRGCKMSLGAANYRNRIKGEKFKDQLPLWKMPERGSRNDD